MALNVDSLPSDPEQFKSYLDELNDEQLGKLEAALVERFQELSKNPDSLDETKMARLTDLSNQVQSVRQETETRKTVAMRTRAVREVGVAQHEGGDVHREQARRGPHRRGQDVHLLLVQ
jgi:hypothetical protein